MNGSPPRMVDLIRRAAGVVSARRRGDHPGADQLLQDFPDADTRALAFYALADLSVLLLSQATGQEVDDCLQGMALALARGESD